MKNKLFFGFAVIYLIFGFILAGCGGGTSSGGIVDDPLILYGTSGGKQLIIRISQTDPYKAVLTVVGGEFYEIHWGAELISRGKISVKGSEWLFTPSSGSPGTKTPFSASYSNGILSKLSIPGTSISNLSAGKNGTPAQPGDDDDDDDDDEDDEDEDEPDEEEEDDDL